VSKAASMEIGKAMRPVMQDSDLAPMEWAVPRFAYPLGSERAEGELVHGARKKFR